MFVHGDNLRQKENSVNKYSDETAKKHLAEIRLKYDVWQKANAELIGPKKATAPNDNAVLTKRAELFSTYKEFIDQQHYAEAFDSRSNLHTSVLEEFVFYLFRDLVRDFAQDALIGKSHTLTQPHARLKVWFVHEIALSLPI